MRMPHPFTADDIIPEGYGIPVGPNPEPEPPEPMSLTVEFTLTDGTILSNVFVVPAGTYARRMEVKSKKGTKDLGPIMVMPFDFHDDSKQLHTICRRLDDENPATIDTVEW